MNNYLKKTANYALSIGLAFNMASSSGMGSVTSTTPVMPAIDAPKMATSSLAQGMLPYTEAPDQTATSTQDQALDPKTLKVTITAYSSTADQTDETPFIAASGKHVYDGIIAANFLPFGTKVKIPALFGDKIFTVDDHMNRRFPNRVDVWFATRSAAMKFGIQTAEIVIL